MRGNWTHGLSYIPEAVNYKKMLERCYNPNVESYGYCGAKGVIVEDRWLGGDGLKNFYEDMGPMPSPLHSIDRYPDKRGNYGPSNCRWATPRQQARNKTNNRILSHNGISMTLADWADYFGVQGQSIRMRLKKGISFSALHDEYEKKKDGVICIMCGERIGGPLELCRTHYKLQWSRVSKGLIKSILEIPSRNLKKKA